jgi:type I restriction-modification system DNA methylase subunit
MIYTINPKVDPNFQTPLAVCEYMADMIPTGSKKILEPTPGMGNIVSVLNKRNYEVTAPEDFFLLDSSKQWDCIVMNPPFSTKYAFMDNAPTDLKENGMRLGYYMLSECMKMSNNIIALMPWFTISDSDVRLRYLKNYGIKSLTALPRKTFQYARIQTVVIELQNDFKGDTIFKTFNF